VLSCGLSEGDRLVWRVIAVLFAQLLQQHIEAASTSATAIPFRISGDLTFHIALPMIVPLSGGTVRTPSIAGVGFVFRRGCDGGEDEPR
jgi:hypothetical protein